MNLVLVTSVINTPNNPLSYSKTRSVFNREERFSQTKKTINSIREKIPNAKIMIVECTNFNDDEKNYFEENCDYILNLWERKSIHKYIFGSSKALGEGTMTIEALRWLVDQKLSCINLFKISGRYWLNESFDYENFNNNNLIFKKIKNNINNIFTALFKIPYNLIALLLEYLENNIELMKKKIGYEVLFGYFLKEKLYENTTFVNPIGLQGYVTVCGSLYNG